MTSNDDTSPDRVANGDIVERLRTWFRDVNAVSAIDLMDEAANEIERLRQFDRLQPIKPAEDTHATHATPGQGSVQGEGTLTDEEREAIEWFAEVRKPLDSLDGGEYVATLRKLLGRTNSPQPFAAAYAVYLNGEYDSSYGPDAIDEAMEIAADCNGEIVPLYRSPTLTDEEREAISLAYSRLTADAKYGEVAATLKALLDRVRK